MGAVLTSQQHVTVRHAAPPGSQLHHHHTHREGAVNDGDVSVILG